MRQITFQATSALMARETFRKSNTEVYENEVGDFIMALHGNPIAKITPEGEIWIRSAGWETNTTKERLNGLPGVAIHQHNWAWYLNYKVWKDSHLWTRIR